MRTSAPVRGMFRHVQRHALVAAAVGALLVAGGAGPAVAGPAAAPASTANPAPSPAPPSASAALTPASGLLFGAFVAKGAATDLGAAVATFEDRVGRKLDVHRVYHQWDQDVLGGGLAATVQRGRTPALSIATRTTDGTRLSWAAIARGDHDARIVAQAAALRDLGVPLFLTLQHEPELATGHGTADDYRAAWRRYVQVFRAQGAANVVWTWVVTPTPFSAGATTSAAALYPGDDVVDWVGLDVYNWFGCLPGGSRSWTPVATSAAAFRAFAQARAKPAMIAEWGSVEDPADPQRKAAWIRDSMATWASWPEVKAVLYFHQHGSCPWWVDSSSSSLAAFAGAGAAPAARTRTNAFLHVSATHGSAPLAVTIDASRSSGAGHAAGAGITTWSLDPGDGTPPTTGTGTPPAAVAHTYAAGRFQARLTVTDAAGRTATDVVPVVAAPAPTVTAGVKDVTTTAATLQALVDLHGHTGTVRLEWGPTDAYGNAGPVTDVAAVSYVRTVNQPVTGLQPGTTYHVRTTATSPAGTTVVTSTFETAGPPTSSRQYTSGSTSTSTSFMAQVHPHRLPTTAWLEFGPTPALGTTSPVTEVAALSYEKTVSSGLVTGLAPATTYYYRVVAQNSSGTFVGPVLSMRTPR